MPPQEVAALAGHSSVSFTLDRYRHLYPEADTALRDRLDCSTAPPSRPARAPSFGCAGSPAVAPARPRNRMSAADDQPTTL